MRLKNISSDRIAVAGLPMAPGRIAEFDEDEFYAWLHRSQGNRILASTTLRDPDKMEVQTHIVRERLIIEGIVELDRANDDHWNRAGAPALERLRVLSGVSNLMADERDRHWATIMGSYQPDDSSEDNSGDNPNPVYGPSQVPGV